MNLILIDPQEVRADGRVRLDDQRAAHARDVLRASPGKILRVGLLNGPLGKGTVERKTTDSVTLYCEWETDAPLRPPVDLLLAMPRPKVLKRLWAQLAALGIGRIILINAKKVERFYFDTHVLKPAFYTKRLIEGLQQARDTRLPDVTVVKQLKPFLEDEMNALFPKSEKRIIADPSGPRTVSQCLHSAPKRACLAVGPEGGWTSYELKLFEKHGFEAFSVGSRILRTDTACIALISLLAESLRNKV